MKKNIILSYSAPEFEIYEVAAERGFGNSGINFDLPGFNVDQDDSGLEF
jgi:hypothetical protein